MNYRLYREQKLNCDLEIAWDFFSSPLNLSVITPDDMKFTILTELKNEEIFEGMLIDYHISPILGIRLNWRTEITQVDYQKSFTDVQLKGPYKYWQHFHSFRSVEDGVVVTDLVDYALPFGFIGSLAHRLSVKNKLEKIFDYRMQVLDQKFNQ